MADMNENHKNEEVVEIALSEEQQAELKKFVSTEVYATATANLQTEIDEELKIPDSACTQAFLVRPIELLESHDDGRRV